jgi:predicted RecA/RadA family phage recombinase
MGAKYIYSLDNSQPMTVKITTNAAVVEGDILAITSGLVGPLSAADSDIIGIAMGDAASGAEASVLLLGPMSVIRVPFAGSTKKTLADADRFGTLYDWNATNKVLNLDDTNGGVFAVVNYVNEDATAGTGTADVVINAAKLWTA